MLWHLSPPAERFRVNPYVGKSVEYTVGLTLRIQKDTFDLTESRTSQRTVSVPTRGATRLMLFLYLLTESSELR